MALEEIKEKPLETRIAYWRSLLGCEDAKSLNKYMVKLAPVTTDVQMLMDRKEKERKQVEKEKKEV